MKRYQLFKEWGNKQIFGDTLGDAVRRLINGLEAPTYYDSKGREIPPEKIPAGMRIVRDEMPGRGTRGNREYVSAIIESSDGSIHEIDATIEEVIL